MQVVYHIDAHFFGNQPLLVILSKRCTSCFQFKSLDNFRDNRFSNNGMDAICEECIRATQTGRQDTVYHGVTLCIGNCIVIYLLYKSCSKCNEDKPIDEFYLRSNGWPVASCKNCEIENSLKWHYNHPEIVKHRNQVRKHNPEYIVYHREKARERYNNNPEARRQSSEWHKADRKANPLKKRELESRRDARKRATAIGRVSYKRILARDGYICHICGKIINPKDLHFDHVIPLARGGSHTEDNIKPSHAVCNVRKKAKLPSELTAYDRRGVE